MIAVGWIGALHLVYRLTEGLAHNQRCLAIAVFGWSPAGVSQSLAEGHNDIAMVALALLWLLQLMRGRTHAPVALAASVLCKYVTAPLLLVDALYALRYAKIGLAPIPAAARPAGRARPRRDGAVLPLAGVLRRRPAGRAPGISCSRAMPSRRSKLALGLTLLPLELAVTALFPAYAAYATWTAWNEPTADRLLQAALAVMSAVMFTAVSHLWPWYVIWALALAAAAASWWLSRFIIGVCRHIAVHAGLLVDRAVCESSRGGGVRMYALAILWVSRDAAGSSRLTIGGGGRACIRASHSRTCSRVARRSPPVAIAQTRWSPAPRSRG